jgi:hypothetical protein
MKYSRDLKLLSCKPISDVTLSTLFPPPFDLLNMSSVRYFTGERSSLVETLENRPKKLFDSPPEGTELKSYIF